MPATAVAEKRSKEITRESLLWLREIIRSATRFLGQAGPGKMSAMRQTLSAGEDH